MDVIKFYGYGIGCIYSQNPTETLEQNGFVLNELIATSDPIKYYIFTNYFTEPTKYEKAQFEDMEVSDMVRLVNEIGSDEFKSALTELQTRFSAM